jgi:hypothetical protein
VDVSRRFFWLPMAQRKGHRVCPDFRVALAISGNTLVGIDSSGSAYVFR